MHAALRNSEWDEAEVHYPHAASTKMTYVFRRGPPTHQWEAWLVVGESAILKSLGRSGMGLYAARSFSRDAIVGRYEGTVVGTYPSRQAALDSNEARRLVRRAHDKLITRRLPQGGVELVDGESSGAPHIPMVNDPRGTALTPNAEITEGGYLRIVHARVPAFDLERTLQENARSELRIEYGSLYWKMMDALGTNVHNSIHVE